MKTIENPLPLSLTLRACTHSWVSLFQLTPTAHTFLKLYPSVMAVELTIVPTPNMIASSSVLIGSPNAWLLEEGNLMCAQDVHLQQGMAEALWQIGREASYCSLKPWLEEEKLQHYPLLSLLIFPEMFVLRDAENLEALAEMTWQHTLEQPIPLDAIGYCSNIKTENAYRLRAQSRHLAEIYQADLGTPVALQKLTCQRQKVKETKKPT